MSNSISLEDKLKEETETLKERAECLNEINLMREKSLKYSKYSLGLLLGSLISSITTLYYVVNNQDIYIPIFLLSAGLYLGYDELKRKNSRLLSSMEEIIRYKC